MLSRCWLTLVTLSLYALIAVVVTIEGKSVHGLLAGAVPDKSSAGILAGLGLLFFLRSIGVIVGALLAGEPLPVPELATNVADFLTVPAWILGGLLLWQRKAAGYVVGMGLLFQASMLFVALIAFLLLQPLLTAAPFAPIDVVVVFAMGLFCFIPFARFVRGAMATRS